MSEEKTIEDLVRKNKQIKSRIQKAIKRPHPLGYQSKTKSDYQNPRPLMFDLEHSRTPKSIAQSINQPSRDISYTANIQNQITFPKQKSSFGYNSTLFKNLEGSDKFQIHHNNDYKTDDFIQNFSSASGISNHETNRQYSESYNIIDKIDEVLANARNSKSRDHSKYLSNLPDNSSQLSQQSLLSSNKQHQFKFTYQLPSSKANKLKTIEEQKQTLTIQNNIRSSQNQPQKIRKEQRKTEKEEKNLKIQKSEQKRKKKNDNLPPLASNLNSTIERQKKKLQSTMLDFRRVDHHDEMDKESIAFDLSDSENEIQRREEQQKKQQYKDSEEQKKFEKELNAERENEQRKRILLNQKQDLMKELEQVNYKLNKIYDFSEEQF